MTLLTAVMACSAGDGLSPGASAALRIEQVSAATPLEAMVGTNVPDYLVVKVTSGNHVVAGVPVSWSTNSGRVYGSRTVNGYATANDGLASAYWELGNTPGPVEAHAYITSRPDQQVTFAATALRRIRGMFLPIADTVSAIRPVTLTAKIVYADNGDPLEGMSVKWTRDGKFDPPVSVTNAAGLATTTWTPGYTGFLMAAFYVTNMPGYLTTVDSLFAQAIPGPLDRIDIGAESGLEVSGHDYIPPGDQYSMPMNFFGDTVMIRASPVDTLGNRLTDQELEWTVTGNSFRLAAAPTPPDPSGSISVNAVLTGTPGVTVIHIAALGTSHVADMTLQTSDTAYDVHGLGYNDGSGGFVSRMNGTMPAVDTIPIGATMTWDLAPSGIYAHLLVLTPMTGITAGPQGGNVLYTATFTVAGTYQYVDPRSGFTGTVVVR